MVMRSKFAAKSLVALFLSLSASLFLFSPALQAQDETQLSPAPSDTQDPPSRVARISYVDGSVSMQPGGTGEWGTAALNRPVTIGDKIWTDQDSRAELQ